MRKCFTIFLLLTALCSCSFLQASPLEKRVGSALRMLEKYSTKNGQVPLILKNGSFFVHVDFVDHEKDASDTDRGDEDYGTMMPALYTDKLFFGKSCQGFSDYCTKYSFRCKNPSKQKLHFTFPYFESGGQAIESAVFLDYSHWKLKTNAMISHECSGFYDGGYGLLGMGFAGESLINYLTSQPSFAVSISKNLKSGSLSFKKDFSKARSEDPVSKITSDSNWHLYDVKAVTILNTRLDANLNVIFDLGSDSIGFPVEVYKKILIEIQKHPSIGKCETGIEFTPTCNFSGDIRKLPKIYINFYNQSIIIPPEVYVVQTQNSYFYYKSILLRLKALSSDKTQGAYVTPLHKNYVILGYPIMSYYYTVFDGGHKSIDPKFTVKPSISLYPANEYPGRNRYLIMFIIIGVVGLLMIGVVYYCCVKRKDVKTRRDRRRPLLIGEGQKTARRLH